METTTTRDVHELPASDRQALEHLLGQPLAGGQKVFIAAFTPGEAPDEATRLAARLRLQQTLAAAQQHAVAQGITAMEADAAVAEAMEHVRPRRQ